jgi:hypothetical protein
MRYEPCLLVEGHLPFRVHIKNNSDDGGSGDSLNVCMLLPDYTVSHSKRGKYSKAPLNSLDGGE